MVLKMGSIFTLLPVILIVILTMMMITVLLIVISSAFAHRASMPENLMTCMV